MSGTVPARKRESGGSSVRQGNRLVPSRVQSPRLRLKEASRISYHLVWITTLVLLGVGLCMVLSVSTAVTAQGADRFGYLRQQGITAAIGLVGMFVASRIDYRRLRGLSCLLLAGIGLALAVMLIPGVGQSEGGAASWIGVGAITFQPSEFAKLALVAAGAHLLSRRRAVGDLKSFMWPFGVLGLITCGLVVVQPDLGTAVIIAGLVLGLMWVAGMKLRNWLVVTLGCGIVATGVILSNGERMSRILSFLNPSADPLGSGFQLSQSLIALGRGGWFGVGPGESVQKFSYLPKAHTDMIYAILGEEFGLVGSAAIIVLFGILAVACWRLSRRCADPMGKYLIAGCGMLVTLQAIVNIGGVTGALPLTGVPLPFISYGRNSLIVMFLAVGLILSVVRFAAAPAMPARERAESNVTHLNRRRRDGRARSTGARAS